MPSLFQTVPRFLGSSSVTIPISRRHDLQKLVEDGILRASGPLKGLPRRSGFLIMSAASRQEVEAAVSQDPFAREGLIESLTIFEWDPLFGIFAAESSGEVAALLSKAVP
jgi:uncharacterized protein YciI